MGFPDDLNTVEAETAVGDFDEASGPPPLALTIAWHPDPDRIGDRFGLPPGEVGISRLSPTFRKPGRTEGLPLNSKHVSRQPLRIRVHEHSVQITPAPGRRAPLVEQMVLDHPRSFRRADIEEKGLLILLGSRVLLFMHAQPVVPSTTDLHGMVGHSAAIEKVRYEIARTAGLKRTVLIRGETGVGKELVAKAVHEADTRRSGDYVAVNAAALNPTTAVSALFGHRRGAFTGASTGTDGLFGAAEKGTLFLDEIGEFPFEMQPMLLRVLEVGEMQPVGARAPVRCDVRVVAATDADLEAAIAAGRFKAPLYHRLKRFPIHVPPLRERRDDIPRLLLHALAEALSELGAVERLTQTLRGAKPWLSAARVAMLMRYDWPGNIRELFNLADQIAARAFDQTTVRGLGLFDWLRKEQESSASTGLVHPPTSRTGSASHFTASVAEFDRLGGGPNDSGWSSHQVEAVMEASGWSARKAARRLEVPKTTLMRYAERVLDIRPMAGIPDDEVVGLFEEAGGDVRRMVDRLRVSRRALSQRLRAMGLINAAGVRPTSSGPVTAPKADEESDGGT